MWSYQLNRNSRVRGMKITIHPGGVIKVSVSPWIPKFAVDSFVSSKTGWIQKHVVRMKQLPVKSPINDRSEFLRLRPTAQSLVTARLEHFNRHYGLKWTSITIRNQSTRWGSCNARGHLSFNYRLAQVLPELADYVVVHELCHLGQLNHSPKFWALVSETLPNYKSLRRKLLHFHAYKID